MAIPACSAARAIPAQPRLREIHRDEVRPLPPGGNRSRAGEGIGVDRGRCGDADRESRNRGADRRHRGITGLDLHRLYPVAIRRMDMHGKRPRGPNRDRVGSELSRRQWYTGMLGAGTPSVQTGHYRHRSRPHPIPAGRQTHRNRVLTMPIGRSLTPWPHGYRNEISPARTGRSARQGAEPALHMQSAGSGPRKVGQHPATAGLRVGGVAPSLLVCSRRGFSCASLRTPAHSIPCVGPLFAGLRRSCNQWRRRELNPRPQSRKRWCLRAYPAL